MPFTDLHELRDEMDGYADHQKVDASRLDKIAGHSRYTYEWAARDLHIPKTRCQLRAERQAARATRVRRPYNNGRAPLTGLDALREQLRLARGRGAGG
jgi:hypothetical protein